MSRARRSRWTVAGHHADHRLSKPPKTPQGPQEHPLVLVAAAGGGETSMQANVQALSPIEPVVGAEDEASAYRKAIRAFSDVAVALTDAQDQSALLHLVARKICELAGATRCSVYLRDEETGLYKGQVGHAAKDIDADVQRLTAG